jgi:lysyl-tRNA synthetase class 2
LAKPFKTQHNALNTEFYLRVAPELYLKRLIVGGFEKVYEIGRCFRNEGIDRDHNPEFTQVEFYIAYIDYLALMKFTEKLLVYLLSRVNRSLIVPFENNNIDFTPPYPRITFHEALKKYEN